MAKRAFIYFRPELILSIAQGKYEVIENVIPEGTIIVDCFFDPFRWVFAMILEHETFEDFSVKDLYPTLQSPMIKKIG